MHFHTSSVLRKIRGIRIIESTGSHNDHMCSISHEAIGYFSITKSAFPSFNLFSKQRHILKSYEMVSSLGFSE